MARFARIVAVGLPHHVTQRGNNRQAVFQSDQDRILYLKLLREQSAHRHLSIWGYCLMDNHVHLIAAPLSEDSLARALRQAHADYARYANVKRGAVGHFWQNRYFSCPMEDGHCWTALAYVERNPVRAGKVHEAELYAWSSARTHLTGRDATGWLDLAEWSQVYSPERWREVLRTTVNDEAECDRIREATRTGRPFGAEDFAHQLEQRLHRSVAPGKPGRPARSAPSMAGQIELFAEAGGNGE
ncbi:MAG: transposase [Bryobacterales bacterium]|nr:transposase [Bryobacterales bacterium]